MAEAFLNTGYKPPKKEEIDSRNFSLEKAQAPVPFPTSYKTDLSALPILMQAKLPDCVENAVVEVKKYHELKTKGTLYDLSRRSLAIPTVKIDGTPFSNGTNIQVALNVAHNQGIAESQFCVDDHSLSEGTFISMPLSADALVNAATHKIQSYAFVTDLSANGLKNAIYQNELVIIGMHIDENWWTSPSGEVSWSSGDVLPLRPPTPNSPSLSGHCVVLYGYDETYFYLINWWSDQWGNRGYGYFGANDLPTIYEAATIVDLTEEQIQALKIAQNATQQVQEVIHNINPASPNTPQVVSLLGQVVAALTKLVASIFK